MPDRQHCGPVTVHPVEDGIAAVSKRDQPLPECRVHLVGRSAYARMRRHNLHSFPDRPHSTGRCGRVLRRKESIGAPSKLRTFRDGFRILMMFAMLVKETRPSLFFGLLSCLFAAASIVLAMPVFATYVETGLVPRLPTALLSTGLMILAALLATAGLVLDSLARARVEQKRILYLSISALRATEDPADAETMANLASLRDLLRRLGDRSERRRVG